MSSIQSSDDLYTVVVTQVEISDFRVKAQKYNFSQNSWVYSQELFACDNPVETITSLYVFNGRVYVIANKNPSQFELVIFDASLTVISRQTFDFLLPGKNSLIVNAQGIFICAVKRDGDDIRYGFLIKCGLLGNLINAQQIGDLLTQDGSLPLCMQQINGKMGVFAKNFLSDRLDVLYFSFGSLQKDASISTQIAVENFSVGIFEGSTIYFGAGNNSVHNLYIFNQNTASSPIIVKLDGDGVGFADLKYTAGKIIALLSGIERSYLYSILPQGNVLNILPFFAANIAPGFSMAVKNNHILLPTLRYFESGVFNCINDIAANLTTANYFGCEAVNQLVFTLNTFIPETGNGKLLSPIAFQRGGGVGF